MASPSYLDRGTIVKAMADMEYRPPLAHGGLVGGPAAPGYAAHSADAFSMAAQAAPNRFSHSNMEAMICSRMGWQLTTPRPFRELRCAKLNDEKAVVWIIHKDEALTIEDDLNLFPSDALVTSLRLLLA